jgi:hypothetical protein
MPLHDWSDDRGWDGVHQYWITELSYWLRPRLPPHYRVYLGSMPSGTLDLALGRPDVTVREWSPTPATTNGGSAAREPDQRAVALFEIDPQFAVHVYRQGQLVAAIELVSPRNKDRPSSRTLYANRYLGYLGQGVNLLLVDLLPRPQGFSFADAIAAASQFTQAPFPPPCAISYNVGGPADPVGRFLDIWRQPLTVGSPLPSLPLWLTGEVSVPVDLEFTYSRAAAAAYLD